MQVISFGPYFCSWYLHFSRLSQQDWHVEATWELSLSFPVLTQYQISDQDLNDFLVPFQVHVPAPVLTFRLYNRDYNSSLIFLSFISFLQPVLCTTAK